MKTFAVSSPLGVFPFKQRSEAITRFTTASGVLSPNNTSWKCCYEMICMNVYMAFTDQLYDMTLPEKISPSTDGFIGSLVFEIMIKVRYLLSWNPVVCTFAFKPQTNCTTPLEADQVLPFQDLVHLFRPHLESIDINIQCIKKEQAEFSVQAVLWIPLNN